MHPDPKRILPIVLILGLVGFAWWYFSTQGGATADSGMITASGTIEATQVDLASEIGGKLLEVNVREGDEVQAGELILSFEDKLLQAQLDQALATLEQAKANYELVVAGPSEEQRQVMIASAEAELLVAQLALDDLYDKAPLNEAQALRAISEADDTLDDAQEWLDNINTAADPADVDAAWAAVVIAEDKLERADDKFEPFEKKSDDNVVRARMQAAVAEAQKQYDAVVTRYNNIIGTPNQYELSLAETGVTLAQARLDEAQRYYDSLENGLDPDAVATARARIETAQANLAAARADTSAQQVALAAAQIQVAEAAVNAIRVRMDELSLYAPEDGIVIARAVQPGEVSAPGAPLVTLVRLNDLRITVYVTEDRYGAIRLGQSAKMVIDSFPGEVFEAQVVRIADQAEFTPRNVQTEEGRRTTVFAVELAVTDADGRLKPGMPADVEFDA